MNAFSLLFSELNLSPTTVDAGTLTVLIVGVIKVWNLMENRSMIYDHNIQLSCVDLLLAFIDGQNSPKQKLTNILSF